MSDMTMDVLFVGNAIMDVLSACDETFLSEHDIEKGGMNLIDEDALYLYQAMPDKQNNPAGQPQTAPMALPVWAARPDLPVRWQKIM